MSTDDTQTDKSQATVDTAQQNQDAAKSDPNAVGTASTAGAGDAAQSGLVQTDEAESGPTFGQRAEALIEEAEAEFRQLWEETEFDVDEIIAWFKKKLNPAKA